MISVDTSFSCSLEYSEVSAGFVLPIEIGEKHKNHLTLETNVKIKMSLPSKMRVLKVLEPKKAAIVEAPVPDLKPGYILVKVT